VEALLFVSGGQVSRLHLPIPPYVFLYLPMPPYISPISPFLSPLFVPGGQDFAGAGSKKGMQVSGAQVRLRGGARLRARVRVGVRVRRRARRPLTAADPRNPDPSPNPNPNPNPSSRVPQP
jgi:hypothetical protein